MAFPTIPTTGNGRLLSQNQNNTTATRTFPSLTGLTKNAGDLLVAIVIAYERSAAGATFSGWTGGFTEVADIDGGATTPAIGIATKISTGSETGTFAVTQAATVTGHCSLFVMAIAGARLGGTVLEVTAVATGTGAAADPGALNPANWDVEDTLWIAAAMNGETSTTGSWTGLGTPTAPTNYSNANSPGIGTDAVGGIHAAVAFRQNAVSSENVGTWTGQDTSNARNAAILIAIRPAIPDKVGSGISPRSGDLHWNGVRVKTGRGLLGLRAYAGTGVSANVASGPDDVTFAEAGSGILAAVGSGVAEKVAGGASNEKTGAGVRGHVGAASDAVVFDDPGGGVSARIASGTDAALLDEAGSGVSPRVANGTDATDFVEVGAATSARIAASPDEVTSVESGTGILALIGSGVAVKSGVGNTYEKTGFGRLGSGRWTTAGTGVRGHVGSGVAEKVSGGNAKSGSAVSARVGAGDQTIVYVETSEGYEVEPPFLEGDNPPQLGLKGSGVAEKVSSAEKAGSGVRGHVGSAVDALAAAETGAGERAHAGAATDVATFAEAGAGILQLVASGASEKSSPGGSTYSKDGSGVRDHVGAGADGVASTEALSGVLIASASASDSIESVESGTGVISATASGAKVTSGQKSGSGISGRAASGAKAIVYGETASGEQIKLSSALDSATFVESGAGVRGHLAEGDAVKPGQEKFGPGIIALSASGSDTIVGIEGGSGVSSRASSAADTVVYARSGSATSERVGSGDQSFVLSRSGVGVLSAVGSGFSTIRPTPPWLDGTLKIETVDDSAQVVTFEGTMALAQGGGE